MSEQIYRIINLARFRELIEGKVLGFVSYDTWEDINEGYALRAVRTDGGRAKIVSVLRDFGLDKVGCKLVIAILDAACHSVHMQSWSMTEENDAMWKLYSDQGNSVQITTTLDHISRLEGVTRLQVRYEKLQLREEIRRIMEVTNGAEFKVNIEQVFATKSPAFEHEHEVRLITSIDSSLIDFRQNFQPKEGSFPPGVVRELVTKLISMGELKISDMSTVMRQINPNWLKPVSFKHIPDFVQNVRVSPTATKNFVEEVESICTLYGLPFAGKSRLYSYEEVE